MLGNCMPKIKADSIDLSLWTTVDRHEKFQGMNIQNNMKFKSFSKTTQCRANLPYVPIISNI